MTPYKAIARPAITYVCKVRLYDPRAQEETGYTKKKKFQIGYMDMK